MTAVPAPPPPRPAALVASTESLQFPGAVREQTFTLTNNGSDGAPLTFRILSDSAWVSAEPAAGSVSGSPVSIRVRVDASLAGTDAEAHLRVNSTAGIANIAVSKDRDLSGQYAGDLEVTQPFAIARSTLTMHVLQSPDGTSLTGFVDPETSLLFPSQVGVAGTIGADGSVELTVIVAGAPGSVANPSYPRPLRRTITLRGTVSPEGLFEGDFVDSLSGPRASATVDVGGHFRLRRVGEARSGQATAVPDLPTQPLTSPFTATERSNCYASCPNVVGANCSTPLGRGKAYLAAAGSFYRAFQATPDGQSPYQTILNGSCGGSACINLSQVRCAQLVFEDVLTAPVSSPITTAQQDARDQASRGLLDTYEIPADYYQLRGSEDFVSIFEQWKSPDTTSLDTEVQSLKSAYILYTAGVHSFSSSSSVTMLDPWALELLLGPIGEEPLRSGQSFLPELLGDLAADKSRGKFEHLRRVALGVSGALRTRLELVDRLHRLGPARLTEARTTARSGALQGYIDLALLSAVMSRAQVTPAELAELGAVLRDFQALSARYDALATGRNPAGYTQTYVPFFFKPGSARNDSNFLQIYADAAGTFTPAAMADADKARTSSREFEASQDALSTQMLAQLQQLRSQLNVLCGSSAVATCGGSGSQFDNAKREVTAANERIRLLLQRVSNLHEEMRIERDRARRSVGINELEATLIMQDGRRLNALEDQEAVIDSVAAVYQAAGSLMTGLASGSIKGVFGIFGAALSLEGQLVSITGHAQIDKARNELATRQRARVEFNQAQEKLINSAALIQTKMLESYTLSIELEMARESLLQAVASVTGTLRQAQLVEDQIAQVSKQGASTAYRLLTFRMYGNAATMQALRTYRRAMDWAYLATRALEYELNVSYGPRETLWQKRTAAEVNAYLLDLYDYYTHSSTVPLQGNVDVVSVRDTLLGLGQPLRDPVTGKEYSPRERFRRYVADPAHRDAQGNLSLNFETTRPDAPLFSQAVCNDRILSVRANLVGDNLGAGVTKAVIRLTHGGTSYQRNCDSPFDLVPYNLLDDAQSPRVARVEAGINASNPLAPTPNTDLLFRPLLAGPWTLKINQDTRVETANAGLDLAGLDDIELIFEHSSKTIQQ
ncbi:hypothetical protein FGE12_06655 [Aggregicoccus sp. 17bor-14]|uniref:hypothetical protein n=1 Tax=Myxococcaceae TaxID=31 RepID=UPI00129C8DAE|nr:hypothetical protein [Simulacricoccus sp. 17bor-14]MRI87847.1 hypothetical protein [Aggregicoccus sp. 17bor-14]